MSKLKAIFNTIIIVGVFAGIIGAAAAVLVVPEFRELFGLSKINTSTSFSSNNSPPEATNKDSENTNIHQPLNGAKNDKECNKDNPPLSCLWK